MSRRRASRPPRWHRGSDGSKLTAVRFRVEHEFPGARDAVADILCDPAFHTRLELPDLSRPEVVEQSTIGTARILRLRYEFVGHLDPIARRILAGRRLTWIQELRLDIATYVGRLSFAAEAEADRLHGSAAAWRVSCSCGYRSSAGPLSAESFPASSVVSTSRPTRSPRRSPPRVETRFHCAMNSSATNRVSPA